MNTKDTIIAPATPSGEGSVAIIRISGCDSYTVLLRYFKPTLKISGNLDSHRLYHGFIRDNSSNPIDEVMAVYMAAPNTYTRDDVVEIQCHGSRQVVKSILNLFQSEGVRLAKPGEFTYRAFVNGRIDLSQAEAVSRLIRAHSESARRIAISQVEGALSQRIHFFSSQIKKALVYLEAWIDFPEEDLPEEDLYSIDESVSSALHSINQLLKTYSYGRIQVEGASILLIGQANVGKSSLLNCLLGEERAIVTDIPGTTRDILEEGVEFGGLPVRLIDTAGLRQTEDVVELEGIRRVASKMNNADLIFFLVDGSKKFSKQDHYAFEQCKDLPAFLVLTKSDLAPSDNDLSFIDFPVCRVSAKTGAGIEKLKQQASRYLTTAGVASGDSVMLTERRHYEALFTVQKSLARFVELLRSGETLDILSFELREALSLLGQITGDVTTESLLDDIFSGFCIGK